MVLSAVVALACKGADAADPAPTKTGKPRASLPSSMVALGDSITAGVGACLSLSACARNSWATGDGTLVSSHYRRILAGNPEARFGAALGTLHRGLPQARILVVSIPDVYHVWEVGHTNRIARDVWALGVCPSLLANPASTAPADAARRQRFRDRVDAYDAVLAAVCKEYGPRCRYDNGAAHGTPFGIEKLNTLDYFHPNVDGQAQLAELTYPGSFTWG